VVGIRASARWYRRRADRNVTTGRTIKCLMLDDDSTHEEIAVSVEQPMGDARLSRGHDVACSLGAKPQAIGPDNGPPCRELTRG
jgi:hypothetical protein